MEKSLGPQSGPYIRTLIADIENQKEAVKSGDKMAMGHSVEKGAKDTKKGASAFKAIPGLFKLANKEAPEKLEELGAEIVEGIKTPEDENKMLGKFATKIKQYAKQPAQ